MTSWFRIRAARFVLAVAMVPLSAWTDDTLVTITHTGYTLGTTPVPAGIFAECRGTPTCVSEYNGTTEYPGCTGSFAVSVRHTITGLTLTQSSLQGTITMAVLTPTSCTSVDTISFVYTYSGSWSPTARTGSITINGPSCTYLGTDICASFRTTIPATIKAGTVPPPVFPMTVTTNITPVSATADAQINFRPQDVGTSGSVYVFAVAPSAQVRGGRDPGAVTIGLARAKAGE